MGDANQTTAEVSPKEAVLARARELVQAIDAIDQTDRQVAALADRVNSGQGSYQDRLIASMRLSKARSLSQTAVENKLRAEVALIDATKVWLKEPSA